MIGRKKPEPVRRNPNIQRQKQAAFQYSSNRSPSERKTRDNSPEEEAEKAFGKSSRRALTALITIVFVIFAIFASILSAKPKLQIVGDQQALKTSYEQDAADIASKGVNNRSKLTINRAEITKDLQARNPELMNIDVVTPILGNSAVIKASVAKPVLMLTSDSKQYLIDTDGLVLIESSSVNSGFKSKNLLLMNDKTNTPVKVGKPALTSEQVAYALEINRQSSAKQLKVESIELTAGGGEMDVRFADNPYYVKFNAYENVQKSFGTFMAAREYSGKGASKPAEYIDVRVPERAYIK